MFRIAIIGRPNVGKSTLFNKLIGRNFAITDDTPGVTRDRKEAEAKLGPLRFIAIDTAGLEHHLQNSSLEKRMVEQTQYAVDDADLCLFVVDGKLGLNNDDYYFAEWLRKIKKNTILIANKCENLNEEVFGKEYYKLGFGKPIAISAEHKIGFGDLYEKIAPEIDKYYEIFAEIDNPEIVDEDNSDTENEGDDAEDFAENNLANHSENSSAKNHQFQIAVIGKPNAGKSSFLNKVLGKDRFITGPEAGITRDAISVDFNYKNQQIRFIDTAGIRKKSAIHQKLEKLSTLDSYRALRFAQVIILLIDANSLLDHQDLALAGQVLKEGRALIFAINKIDQVSGDKEVFMRQVRQQIQQLLPEISGAPIIGVSAKTGYNIEKTLDLAIETYRQWNFYISTAKLMEWLKYAESQHAPQLYKGKAIKLKYTTQIKKRPPTFAVFTNHPKPLEGSYQRYLINSLREYFNLNLTPVRLYLRKSDNPFEGKKDKVFSKKLHVKK